MSSKIWFFNQNSYMPSDGPHIRHYTIGKYLVKKKFEPFVFAGNELHHVGKRIDTSKSLYIEKQEEGVNFFYINTHHYEKNDIHRIINIISYYRNIFKVCGEIEKKYGKPDIIYASSMYPTALIAGIKIAKKYGIKCICESRDIIPDGFVTDGTFKANGLIATVTRFCMKKIYYRADALIFTMSGGSQYIIDNRWDREHGGRIDMSQVYYVNNGVDLELSKYNETNEILPDEDLDDSGCFKVVYFGAIRYLNQMPLFFETAKELKKLARNDSIKILMWGNGTKLEEMKNKLQEENLDNIKLKGFVDKKYIPGIAKRADLFIGTGNSCIVHKYGMSFNKLFDYFAGGKPIILPFKVSNSLVKANGAGVELENAMAPELAKEILRFKNMDKEEYNEFCNNSIRMAKLFDYATLTNQIEKIVERLIHVKEV